MKDTSSYKRLASLLAILGLGALLLFSTLDESQRQPATVLPRIEPAAALHLLPSPETPSPRPFPPIPPVLAQSYLVQIIEDHAPLLERDGSRQMRPASLTKVLTSLLAMQELDHNAPVVFSAFAKSAGEKESHVEAGEAFTRNDVIRFAIVESANDAAVALAEAIGRKRGAFSFDDAMLLFKQAANQKARELGMANSQFENSTGLDDVGHYTTAQDLFRLVSHVWENYREIWDFSRAGEADIFSLRKTEYHIASTNQLLSEFPALMGGKTGLTDAAKGTLILLYPIKSNRTAVIIVLGSDNRFEDGRMLIRWLEEAFNENVGIKRPIPS